MDKIKGIKTEIITIIKISQVIDGIVMLLGPVATLSKDNNVLKCNALRAISTALDETYLYFRDLNKCSNRNLDRESQITKYWSAAAIPIRHFDEELANNCDYEAEHWVNPENYTDEQLSELIKELVEVRNAYIKMLSPFYCNRK